jgi:hypothetical protein
MLTSWLQDIVVQLNPVQYWGAAALVALALAAVLGICLRGLRYLRLIEDMSTSRVRSAAQGYVELEGKVECADGKPLRSPLQDLPCVWWSYRVEELDLVADDEPTPWEAITTLWAWFMQLFGARGAGRLVEAGRSHECFLMRDDTGACVIDPDQAQIVGARTRVWTKGTRRFEESVIRAGQSLYALGLFRTPEDHAEAAERREVGVLISTWQLDRLELARRFDANRNGVLDDAEWSAVWQAAAAEVRDRRPRDRPTELHVLCRPGDRRPYLLSVLGQRTLSNRFWFQSITSLMVAATLATLLVWSLRIRGLM